MHVEQANDQYFHFNSFLMNYIDNIFVVAALYVITSIGNYIVLLIKPLR